MDELEVKLEKHKELLFKEEGTPIPFVTGKQKDVSTTENDLGSSTFVKTEVVEENPDLPKEIETGDISPSKKKKKKSKWKWTGSSDLKEFNKKISVTEEIPINEKSNMNVIFFFPTREEMQNLIQKLCFKKKFKLI